MKQKQNTKPIQTIPEGAYEGGVSSQPKEPCSCCHENRLSTDLQGNGYPIPCAEEKIHK